MPRIVRHKYMAQEVPDDERRATFAARHPLLDLILRRLRERRGTSFLLTGPRGAGKSTIVHMVRQSIESDALLSANWLPVVLPEEQPGVTSLRDFLSLILERMADDGNTTARHWYEQCEAEQDDLVSEETAIEGIARVSAECGKTLLVAVENFDQLFDAGLRDERMQSTLRRLLMHEPKMCLLATSVSVLHELDDYEQPFWEYFEELSLASLSDEQTDELLTRRADYEQNADFRARYSHTRGLVRSLNRITGGNPRLMVMLYEVVTLGDVDTAVAVLRQLLDDLTTLYDGLLRRLSPQQRKIVHAMMRSGGRATPAEIARDVRLKDNQVRTLLRRLNESGCVNLTGGGKGREALYTVQDRLFATWYQLRYLRPNRRRIEMFVDVLRAWFTAEERFEELKRAVAQPRLAAVGGAQHELVEHLYASIEDTRFASAAAELLNRQPATHDTEHATRDARAESSDKSKPASVELRIAELTRAIADAPDPDPGLLIDRGLALAELNRHDAAIADFTRVIELPTTSTPQLTNALNSRGVRYERLERFEEAIADYTRVIELPDAPTEQLAWAFYNRGFTYGELGRTEEAIADYTRLIKLPDAPTDQLAWAFYNRGFTYGKLGRTEEEIGEYTRLIELPDAPASTLAHALVSRSDRYNQTRQFERAFVDAQRLIDEVETHPRNRALAFVNSGTAAAHLNRHPEALKRYQSALTLPDLGEEYRWKLASDVIMESSTDDLLEQTSFPDEALRLVIDALPVDSAETATSILRHMARPTMRRRWATVLRRFAEALRADEREKLLMLEPVATVLDSGDPSMLKRLPPEQRDFIDEVLRKFES